MRLSTKLLLLGFLVLLINSAYLISFGEPTLFYIGNVLLHIVLGVALIVPFIVYVCKRFNGMSIIGKGGVISLGIGVISGVYLMFVGATTPNRWLLILHIVAVTLGTILFVGHLLILARRGETEFSRRAAQITVAVLLISLLFPVAARLIQHYRPNPDYLVKNPLSPPTSMYEEGGGTDGPFFPASVETYTGDLIPTDFFLTSQTCAESGCHPDIYKQWNESAHHFASFNNQWYRKSIMYMQDVNGIQPSKWCGGCHDPAILLNGVMDRPIRENSAHTRCSSRTRVYRMPLNGDRSKIRWATADTSSSTRPCTKWQPAKTVQSADSTTTLSASIPSPIKRVFSSPSTVRTPQNFVPPVTRCILMCRSTTSAGSAVLTTTISGR